MTAATFSSLYQGCYDLECHRYQAPEMTQRLLIDVKDMEKLSADHAFVVIRQHSVGKTVIPHMWQRASCLVKKLCAVHDRMEETRRLHRSTERHLENIIHHWLIATLMSPLRCIQD